MGRYERVAECPDLPSAALTELNNQIVRGYNELPAVARRIQSEYKLPPLAFVWMVDPRSGQSGYEIEIPPPFVVPFEPMELDERDSNLLGLCKSIEGFEKWPKSRSRWVRIFFNLVLVAWLLMIVGGPVQRWGPFAGALMAPIGVLALLHGFRFLHPRWVIMPGVLLVRQFSLVDLELYTNYFTPEDSILIVIPGIRAIVYGARVFKSHPITSLECAILVAAWQSRDSKGAKLALEGGITDSWASQEGAIQKGRSSP